MIDFATGKRRATHSVLVWVAVGGICLCIGACSSSKKDAPDTSSVPSAENGSDGSAPVKIGYEESARSRELLSSCIQAHMPQLNLAGYLQVRSLPARINEELQRNGSPIRVSMDFSDASGPMGDAMIPVKWKAYPFWRAVIDVCGQTDLGLKRYAPSGNLRGIKWASSKEDFIFETNDLLLLGVSRKTMEYRQEISREVAVAYSPAAVSFASTFSLRYQIDGKWSSWKQDSKWGPCFGFSSHDLPIPEDAEAVEFSFPVALSGEQFELDIPFRAGASVTHGDISAKVESIAPSDDSVRMAIQCNYPLGVSKAVEKRFDELHQGSPKTLPARSDQLFELATQKKMTLYRVIKLGWLDADGGEMSRGPRQQGYGGKPIEISAYFDEGAPLPKTVRVSLVKMQYARVNMTVSLK